VALAPGTRLGPYDVVAQIGAGGMGEVYRARDTKLNRDVALKVLPDAFALDANRLARFRREAQVLASLNHPNIAAIYGFEDSGSTHALVLELVEGSTLADRIAKGPIPFDEALLIAKQIAEALEAAHEQGIIHRDLKPTNIKVRDDGTVKVLDFGLAKAMEAPSAVRADVTNSPTITTPAMVTGVGMILGTVGYMSPEQAKGRPADKRSDVWAFGCVLYEMLTARRAFDGDDVSDTLAAVLRGEPDWAMLPADVTPAVRTLLERCVKKDRGQRISELSTVLFVVREPTLGAATNEAGLSRSSPARVRHRTVASVAAVLITAAVTSATWWTARPPLVPPKLKRLSLMLPEGQRFANAARRVLAISPDGLHLAYVTADNRLFVRSLSDSEPHQIGANVGALPMFSPDAKSVAFTTVDFMLRRTAMSGGAPISLATLEFAPFGISWTDSSILVADPRRIWRISENGGKRETLLTLTNDDERLENPQILPDRQTVLFTLARGLSPDRWDKAQVVMQSLKTGERKVLVEGGADARYLPSGHIVYALGGVLFAVPFDIRRRETLGGPVAVVEGVRREAGSLGALGTGPGVAQYDLSGEGTLVYLPGPAAPATGQQTIGMISRKGDVEPLKLPSAAFEFPRFSPDGKRITYGTDDGKDAVVWVYDLSGTRAPLRITYQGRNRFPIWSNDGNWVVFQSNRDGDLAIFRQRGDGTGTPERLTMPESGSAHVPGAWSPVGNTLLFDVIKQSSYALFQLSTLDKKIAPIEGVQSINPTTPMFSPDGKWIAYSARNPGQVRNSLYVEPFPPTGAKYQISNDDGHHPMWSSSGKELFFIRRPGQFVVVPVISTSPSFSFGAATELRRLFATTASGNISGRTYDIDRNGDRIVGLVYPTQIDSPSPDQNRVEIVLNWIDELKQRVPVK
jgi:serine/threonine-protein kinase